MKNRRAAPHRRLSLKVFLTVSLLAVSFVTFVSVFFLTTSIYQKSHLRQAQNTARGHSRQAKEIAVQLYEILQYVTRVCRSRPAPAS